MLKKRKLGSARFVILATQLVHAVSAFAFPPYRSTDADTADPYTLELRVGLLKLEQERSETEVLTPLLRTNFGLPNRMELLSEFEYLPEEREFGDGATGVKWVPVYGSALSFGIEALALLPVRSGDDGVGVESQLLATFWSKGARLHVNAGGFHDARVSPAEAGWRASLLAELPLENHRPGVELFAKKVENELMDVRAGVGLIYDVGGFDIRTGLHAGLTDEAPDICGIRAIVIADSART